ncbi:hypothetical protein D3C73_815290 [compost metagenome]
MAGTSAPIKIVTATSRTIGRPMEAGYSASVSQLLGARILSSAKWRMITKDNPLNKIKETCCQSTMIANESRTAKNKTLTIIII